MTTSPTQPGCVVRTSSNGSRTASTITKRRPLTVLRFALVGRAVTELPRRVVDRAFVQLTFGETFPGSCRPAQGELGTGHAE
jgi:hypothetical protein